MEEYKLDFHNTFRRLSIFTPSLMETEGVDNFISDILDFTSNTQRINRERAPSDIKAWLSIYASRIQDERDEWENDSSGKDIGDIRKAFMKSVNPRFILRQWVLEDVIGQVEADPNSGKRVLAKVLQVSRVSQSGFVD